MIALYIIGGLLFLVLAFSVVFCLKMIKQSFGRDPHAVEYFRAYVKRLREQGSDCAADQLSSAMTLLDRVAYEDVSITSFDGFTLRGYWIPSEQAKATVILAHGYHSYCTHDMGMITPFYRTLGFNVLLIHQRSHGESEGKYITFGVKERRDVEDWVRFALSRVGEDHPLFLHGLSMGAATVMMASAMPQVKRSVCGIVADCGYVTPGDEFKHVFKTSMKLPIFPCFYIAAFMTRLICGFSFYEASSADALAQTDIPVLFIHGGKDDFVPTECTEINYKACLSPKQKLIVPEAAHAQSYLFDPELCEQTLADFIHRCLDKPLD